jgi:hypothetical protein
MPGLLKIKYFLFTICLLIIAVSCERKKNDVIPDVPVDFTIDILDYPSLSTLFGSVAVDASDLRIPDRRFAGGFNGNGIIIFNGAAGYFAYDRTCPYDYMNGNPGVKVNIDFTYAICPRCSTYYELSALFGAPTSGPGKYPLKNYRNNFDGRFLSVWNY